MAQSSSLVTKNLEGNVGCVIEIKLLNVRIFKPKLGLILMKEMATHKQYRVRQGSFPTKEKKWWII